MENSTQVELSSSDAQVERKKPGPQAKPKVDMGNIILINKQITELTDRIARLEGLVVRMCHNSGVAHALMKKAGLKPYNPTNADMSKFKD